MPAMDEKSVRAVEEELAELAVVQARMRSEISNLTVGYQRAREGLSPIPAGTLRRNLVAQRAQLTELEARMAELRGRLSQA